jgi:hypothetical protein
VPDYRSLIIDRGPPHQPPSEAVPLQATDRGPLHRASKALDTLPPSGARVLFEWGLQGSSKFLVADAVPYGGGAQVYPDLDTPRVVARLEGVPLTAGHFVGCRLTAIPSGPSVFLELALFEYVGAGGSVIVEVTYTNSDAQSVTSTFELDCPASQLLYAQEAPNPYAAMFTREGVAFPTPLNPSVAEWQKWSRGGDVLASVVVKEVGAPRIVDATIVEMPREIVVDRADSVWPTCMYSHASLPYQQTPSDYPIEQLSSTDPGGGFTALRRALYSHGRQLGPFLFGYTFTRSHEFPLAEWVSYDGGTGDDEGPPCTVNGTTPTSCPFATTTPGDHVPGWDLSHYARQVDHGDQFLDGRVGVLPVWVYARCKVSAGVGTFELRTDGVGWSAITWKTASTTWADVLTPGWLETGIGPEDAKKARLWISNSGANDTSIRYLAVFFRVT